MSGLVPAPRVHGGPRVLVLGWSSVLHGEATAGDVLSMRAVERALVAAGVAVDVAWSAVMRPAGGLALADAHPRDYTHVVWACGPLHGQPVLEVLERFAGCVRIAVGVSVVDAADPAVTGWDAVLPRDAPGRAPVLDLAAGPASQGPASQGPASRGPSQGLAPGVLPLIGVYLAPGQREYGARRRHQVVTAVLGEWLRTTEAARLDLDTRLDPRSWRNPSSAEQVLAVVARLDAVVSQRLHGLVLALARGVPVLAVDPVAGGGKVSDQAAAWGWPAVVRAEEVDAAVLGEQLEWCLSPAGRDAARAVAARAGGAGARDLAALVDHVRSAAPSHAMITEPG